MGLKHNVTYVTLHYTESSATKEQSSLQRSVQKWCCSYVHRWTQPIILDQN